MDPIENGAGGRSIQVSQKAASRNLEDTRSNIPESYGHLDGFSGSCPVQNPREGSIATSQNLDDGKQSTSTSGLQRNPLHSTSQRSSVNKRWNYDIPDAYANLDEVAEPSPVENPNEGRHYQHHSLEEARWNELNYQNSRNRQQKESPARDEPKSKEEKGKSPAVSKTATQLYTISYLILFSILGTLARLGLQALTFYPGAPVVIGVLWANFGGSFIMGFLSEDRMLFKHEWGTPTYDQQVRKARQQDEEVSESAVDLAAAKKAHSATKKTIPLYIGLATGFCGSFTSFSSFIRDVYLALSNDLPTPLDHPADYVIPTTTTSTVYRNGGYSFMALLAVIIITVALCISALNAGAHLALALERFTPSISFTFGRKILDRVCVFLSWGCWLGAIFLAIFPPENVWRGRALFALVFAPLGCLARFYASLYLNGKIPSFPLGTFIVNIFGTVILGMTWDLQHVPLGGVIGCQVLQGVEDGFCGCLTTVSTWVAELTSLSRSHAYKYGAVSVLVALGFLVVVMGSMQWTIGFKELRCSH